MSKENLEILEFEDKKTQAGKRYTRFKTSDGWMSCFDKDSCEKLKDCEGKTVSLEIAEVNGFKNIKKYLGKASDDEDNGAKSERKPHYETAKPAFNQASMYVSYAKDLWMTCMPIAKPATKEEGTTLMENCIKLVQQAKEAFEDKPKVEIKKEIPAEEEEFPDY